MFHQRIDDDELCRLREEDAPSVMDVPAMDIYTAVPPDLEKRGLPVHDSAGLELGQAKKYVLPWNMRSAR